MSRGGNVRSSVYATLSPHLRYDLHLHVLLGVARSPKQLCAMYSPYANTVPAIIAVTALRWHCGFPDLVPEPRYAVIPVTIYDDLGCQISMPKSDLVPSVRTDLPFAWEIQPMRPLRSQRDPIDLAERWAQKNLDVEQPHRV